VKDKIIDGKYHSNQVLEDVARQVATIKSEGKRVPCLVVILVGEDPASQVYVRNKKNACDKVGVSSVEYKLPQETTQQELEDLIHKLNQDITVDGILVQMPLPQHIDAQYILDKIDYHKDVDGFHKYNVGALATNSLLVAPCTPHGVMYLLDSLGVNYAGKHAVIVGASNIVGRPMGLELLNRGATITICHSKTIDLASHTRRADILVVAVGRANIITGDMLQQGAIVIDVGINRLASGKLVGDVDFASCEPVASHITPVPGGVGPMTIAMLLQNTLTCYKLSI